MLAQPPADKRIALRWIAIGVAGFLVLVGRYAIKAAAANRAAAVAEAVAHITMVASSDVCTDAANPIGLVVKNDSTRTVREIAFGLEVKRPDASENLAIDSSNLTWTHVVQPGKQVTTCRAWPAVRGELNARIHHVTFYEPGEAVPNE